MWIEAECRENSFRCSNDICVKHIVRCDGNIDCVIATDELHCCKLTLNYIE